MGEPAFLTPRAWCLPTPGPSWQVCLENALLLVSQLRPPRPLATGAVSEDAIVLPPPFCCSVGAAATTHLRHSLCCSLLLLHTAAVPQSRYQSRDYWGHSGKVQQPCRCTVHAAGGAAVTAAVPQSRYQSRDYWGSVSCVLQPCGCSAHAAVTSHCCIHCSLCLGWASGLAGLLDAKGLVPPHAGSLVVGPHGGRPPAGVPAAAAPPPCHWWGFGGRPPSPTALLL